MWNLVSLEWKSSKRLVLNWLPQCIQPKSTLFNVCKITKMSSISAGNSHSCWLVWKCMCIQPVRDCRNLTCMGGMPGKKPFMMKMVWGWVTASGIGQLAVIDSALNSASNQNILKDNVRPHIQSCCQKQWAIIQKWL